MLILVTFHFLCVILITDAIFIPVCNFTRIIRSRILHNHNFLGFYKIDPHDANYDSKQKGKYSKMFKHRFYYSLDYNLTTNRETC